MLLKLPVFGLKISLVLVAGLACFEKVEGRNYHKILEDGSFLRYCSEDGEECMLSTYCCPGLFCAVQERIGTCLRHESELTRCQSDTDCPQTKCCHRERRLGEIGACAYVCGDNGETLEESVHSRRQKADIPVDSYREDFPNSRSQPKRYLTMQHQLYF